jgi:hypothetical protein
LYDKRDTLQIMSERLVSLRLDDQAQEALRVLTGAGTTRSQAIRDALVDAASRRRGLDLAAEATELAADEDDRAEIASVVALMESLRAAG